MDLGKMFGYVLTPLAMVGCLLYAAPTEAKENKQLRVGHLEWVVKAQYKSHTKAVFGMNIDVSSPLFPQVTFEAYSNSVDKHIISAYLISRGRFIRAFNTLKLNLSMYERGFIDKFDNKDPNYSQVFELVAAGFVPNYREVKRIMADQTIISPIRTESKLSEEELIYRTRLLNAASDGILRKGMVISLGGDFDQVSEGPKQYKSFSKDMGHDHGGTKILSIENSLNF